MYLITTNYEYSKIYKYINFIFILVDNIIIHSSTIIR